MRASVSFCDSIQASLNDPLLFVAEAHPQAGPLATNTMEKSGFDMAFIKEPDVDNCGASGHISVPLKRQKQICQTPYFWYARDVICFEASQSIGGCPNNISSCGEKPLTYTCGLIFGSTVQRSTPTENSAPL